MNYKAKSKDEEELLLFGGDVWSEKRIETSSSDRSSCPTDISTPVTEKSSKDKLGKRESEGNSTGLAGRDSTRRSDDLQSLIQDKQDPSPSNIPTETKTDLSEYVESPRTGCPDWVSFEENSNHANLEVTRDVVFSPNNEFPDGDTSVLRSSTNDHDWVKFDVAKPKGSGNSTTNLFVQPRNHGDVSERPGPNTGRELTEVTESSLNHDVFSNPFDNSELDRINSFAHVTPKRANCRPSDTTHQPERPSLTAASDTTNNESRPPSTASCEGPPPLTEYPEKPTNKTWSVLLRYPDTKRRLRPREWRQVVLKLDGSILQVFEQGDSSAPFREVSLQCFYALTLPRLQQYRGRKVHTVKILYVKYKETSKSLSKKDVQYVAKSTPILKIASSSHLVIREFIEVVKDSIRSLPIFRDRGISHNTEAVYIDVHDTCSALLDSTGKVLKLGILVRVYLRAFISGDAECQLVLNDIHVKSQEEARLREEHMPQRVHKWINLEKCDFHSTVNSDSYWKHHHLVFQPLDSCTFEVMQFRVRQQKPLPLLVSCDLIVDAYGRVEIRAEVKICSDPKLSKYERKNICLYFPIPEVWVPLFMKVKFFHGERSIRSTSAQKAIKMRNKLNRPPCTIEVSTGSAKYEPEYKAIVWRINQLPLLNTTAPADSSHDFTCHVQTKDSSGLPEDYEPHCVMEYEIPYTVASDTNIVNFKVSDQKIGVQEVTYNAYYSYHIQVNTTSLNSGPQDDRWIHH